MQASEYHEQRLGDRHGCSGVTSRRRYSGASVRKTYPYVLLSDEGNGDDWFNKEVHEGRNDDEAVRDEHRQTSSNEFLQLNPIRLVLR